MKLVDTNVLLYAVNADSREHAVARACLEAGLSDDAGLGFAWLALVCFVRLATRRGILAQPLAAEDAMAVVDDWLATSDNTVDFNPFLSWQKDLSTEPAATFAVFAPVPEPATYALFAAGLLALAARRRPARRSPAAIA